MANGVCVKCGTRLPDQTGKTYCPTCQIAAESGSQNSTLIDSVHPTLIAPLTPIDAGRVFPREGRPFGDYQLIRKLGHGGMGTVFEAEHVLNERRVALKVLNHQLDSANARDRFLREGQLAASLNHPHSVYVFGSEEIDGMPVITMELLTGGTLQDRLKQNGPLPVSEAVDAILQVITGLEAAQAKGILHRDIKPSNCFTDASGNVKIGDYGLSISTLGTKENKLVPATSFFGTPAFASPEQIRGDVLDVRSDIYSVGATLYYLLTGKTPFQRPSESAVLAAALGTEPASPRDLRPKIPAGLAQVILRTLAKPADQRPSSYAELGQALELFGSRAPVLATLSRRALAGFVDATILAAATASVSWIILSLNPEANQREHLLALTRVLGLSLILGYYSILEGKFGRTLGKALCHLRLVSSDGSPARIASTTRRAAVFVAIGYFMTWCPILPLLNTDGEQTSQAWRGWLNETMLVPDVILLLLLCWDPRRNRRLSMHERLSRSRVVQDPVVRAGPAPRPDDEPIQRSAPLAWIGPYTVPEPLHRTPQDGWVIGFDPRLLRKVWIHLQPAGAPAIELSRRNIDRPGRLRWLNGKRTAAQSWDAYEAPTGIALTHLLGTPHPWRTVRYWVADLADELDAARRDHTTLPCYGLEKLWITADNRLKLLDFPAPWGLNRSGLGITPAKQEHFLQTSASEGVHPHRDEQLFLKQLACAALEGRYFDEEEIIKADVRTPLPLGAWRLLHSLPNADPFSLIAKSFRSLLEKPAEVSRLTRIAIIACFVAPSFFLMLVDLQEKYQSWLWKRAHAEYVQVLRSIAEVERLGQAGRNPANDQTVRALEVYIMSWFTPETNSFVVEPRSGRDGPSDKPSFSFSPYQLKGRWPEVGNARVWIESPVFRRLQAHPYPSDHEIAAALQQLKPWLADQRVFTMKHLRKAPIAILNYLFNVAEIAIWLVAVPSWVSALVWPGGFSRKFLNIAIVSNKGEIASRWRLVYRISIALLPVLAMGLIYHVAYHRLDQLPAIALVPLVLLPVILATGAIYTIRNPACGIHDRIAGTTMVPQ